ncbi:SRPBCC family protein (plasmid) [Streptomyces sp. FXJ1.172]|jgi:hypothetical protein|uniref:SRPBCC family protein n=1 Tax=Streptomyces sp. FXJ1.172 TaxID=710705 RepID=UPI0023DD3A46|nr:SRPBCC family protein [Streptomyces sp. FXJ1.172]WEP01120.1 SRPBCC family protein [Streptomyces sp. FXJ1.172]
MSGERVDRATHHVHVSAPAGVVYAVLADGGKLPLYCSGSVHVECLESDGGRERVRMWSLMNGQVKSWTSWRHLDPVERRMEFRQDAPASSHNSVGGVLTIRAEGPRETQLELRFGTDGPPDAAWLEQMAGLDIRTQLMQLKSFAERWTRLDDLVLTFEDSIHVHGPAELAYDVLYRAGSWPEAVPGIARVALAEESPGVQRMTLDRLTESGAHTTEAVRICFPHAGRIVYKQTRTLPLLAAHTGEWSVVPDERGATVTSKQTVVLREEDIAAVLGPRADLADARRYVRGVLGRDSLALLTQVRRHAESAVRML